MYSGNSKFLIKIISNMIFQIYHKNNISNMILQIYLNNNNNSNMTLQIYFNNNNNFKYDPPNISE